MLLERRLCKKLHSVVRASKIVMEDITRRLELNSPRMKEQAIERVLSQIVRRKDPSVISEKSPKNAEVDFLWSRCGDADSSVSHAACRALVELVTDHRAADFHYVLSRLLSYAPSVQNVSGLVAAVCNLIVFEAVVTINHSGQDKYTSPYGIRLRPHPFITLLSYRADCWPFLLHHVAAIFTWPKAQVRTNALELLKPVLVFILLDPNQPSQHSALRLSLPGTCLRASAADKSCHRNVVAFLVNIVQQLQVKSAVNIGETCQYLRTCFTHLKSLKAQLKIETGSESSAMLSSGEIERHLATIARNGLRLCMDAIAVSPNAELSELLGLVLDVSEFVPQSLAVGEVLCAIATLMYRCPGHDQHILLNLLRLCLQCESTFPSVLLGCVVLPVLTLTTSHDRHVTSKALEILKRIGIKIVQATSKQDLKNKIQENVLNGRTHFLEQLCTSLSRNQYTCAKWLRGVQSNLARRPPRIAEVSAELLCVVSGVFVMSDNTENIELSLEVLRQMAGIDHALSVLLLPVLLYKLNRTDDPELKVTLLHALPTLATNKVAVTPILRTIQHMGTSPPLRALSIRLLTSLWREQDRVFSYLQQAIVEPDLTAREASGGAEGVREVVLAKAASIRDICRYRPCEHGRDMVAPLSQLLNECGSQEGDAPAISLLLEALYYLCQAQEIDVKTAWSVLAAKLSSDERPLVICGVCRLLSLVANFTEENEAYEVFGAEVVERLWRHATESAHTSVQQAAFQALAQFSTTLFQLQHFPKEVTGELLAQALAAAAENPEEAILTPVSGKCYTDLLLALPEHVQKAYGEFLSALLCREVRDLPRGQGHGLGRRHVGASRKHLQTVPQFMTEQYERNRQPGKRQALSVGLLFSYDPQPDTGRDGRPGRSQIAQLGRLYHRMLYTLMHEVPVDPADWYRCVYIPGAWTAFMQRCYTAYVKSRVAELQLKLQSGEDSQGPEENQLQQDTAWLWARDKLFDLIKSSSKGSPAVSGNALCALAGLAVASCRYAAGLSEQQLQLTQQVPEHLSHTHWLSMLVHTLLAVMEPTYTPPGRVFAVCGMRADASEDRTPCSLLARASAAVALSQIIRPLISLNAELVCKTLALLCMRLPANQTKRNLDGTEVLESDPGVIQFYHGIALGWVLSGLFEEKFMDVFGTQGMLAVWKAVGDLENSALNSSNERTGSALGLSVALASMCRDGKPDTTVHLSGLRDRLLEVLATLQAHDTAQQALCLCLANLSACGYAANILPQASVDQAVAALYQAHVENLTTPGTATALGTAVFGLLAANHPSVLDLARSLYLTWTDRIPDQGVTVEEKQAAMLGAACINGAANSLLQMSLSTDPGALINSTALVNQLRNSITGSAGFPPALANSAPWILGQLSLALEHSWEANTAVPSSYSYLDETSLLRAFIQLLQDASRLGPEQLVPELVSTTLEALVTGTSGQSLPPLNWASLLAPLMRMSYGEKVQCLCLRVAVSQSVTSTNAAMFVTSWLQSPLYDSLSQESRMTLFDRLPTLIKAVAPNQLKDFFNQHVVTMLESCNSMVEIDQTDGPVKINAMETPDIVDLCAHALMGLVGALRVVDPPNGVTLILYQTLEQLYQLQAIHSNREYLRLVCEALCEVPDEVLDRVTLGDLAAGDRLPSAVFTRCYLVAKGNQSLAWLSPAIDAVLQCTGSLRDELLPLFYSCLLDVTCSGLTNQHAGVGAQSVWLLELMGHTRNLISGMIQLTTSETSGGTVLDWMVALFSCAMVAFGPSDQRILFGVTTLTDRFTSSEETPRERMNTLSLMTSQSVVENSIEPIISFCDSLYDVLAHSTTSAIQVEPWKQMTSKIIDWMFLLLESKDGISSVKETVSTGIYETLSGSRHIKEFAKPSIWGKCFYSS